MKSFFSKLHLPQALSFALLLGVLLGSPIFTFGQQENLARTKVTPSSSNPQQSTTNANLTAANAVDGNTATISATATTNGSNWWQIDLGAYYHIDNIFVRERGDCCQGHLKDFYVLGSDIPFNNFPVSNSMTLAQMQGNYAFAAYQQSAVSSGKTFSANNKICRYVRVEHNSKNTTPRDLVLGDLEVNGNPSAVSSHTPAAPSGTTAQILAEKNGLDTEMGSTNSQGEFIKDPNIKIPKNFQKVRGHMLKIANLCRQDPDYRKNNAYNSNNNPIGILATDLSGTHAKPEGAAPSSDWQLYKTSQSAPYFTDLVENEQLRKAAQYHAEHMAKYGYLGHTQSQDTNYNGNTMVEHWHRATAFGFTGNMSGEACSMDLDPQCWTRGNTHFRPFFNVGSKVSAVGFGAAKGADGKWYVCAIFDKVN